MLFIHNLKTRIKEHTDVTIALHFTRETQRKEEIEGNRSLSPLESWKKYRSSFRLCPMSCADSALALVRSLKSESFQQQQTHSWVLVSVCSSRLLARRWIGSDNRGELFQINRKNYSQRRSCSLQACHVSLIHLGQLALFHRHYVSKQKCVCFVIHCLNPCLLTFDLILSLSVPGLCVLRWHTACSGCYYNYSAATKHWFISALFTGLWQCY